MSNFQIDYTGQQVNELLAKADTALQEVPDAYALKSEIPTNNNQLTNGAGYITTSYHDSTKQDVINDLSTIRSGAELGATALQNIPQEYIKNTDYATDTNAGVIKVSGTYGTQLSQGGYIQARLLTKEQFTSGSYAQLIGKGTYENVRLDKSVEEWQFTLADGSTVTKKVVLGE